MANLASRTLAFLDVETTGFSPWFGDRICEIPILRC
jgi:DNA polymerase III epsilon subunit-like protein